MIILEFRRTASKNINSIRQKNEQKQQVKNFNNFQKEIWQDAHSNFNFMKIVVILALNLKKAKKTQLVDLDFQKMSKLKIEHIANMSIPQQKQEAGLS